MEFILEHNPRDLNYPELSRLNDLCFRDEPVSEYDFRAYTSDGIWTVYHGEMLVGFGAYMLGEERSHIRRIAVHPDYRSLGLGSRLMAAMIQDSQNAAVARITLNVQQDNLAAIRLYEKFGFSIQGESVQFVVTINPAERSDRSVMAIPAYLQEIKDLPCLDRLTHLAKQHDPPDRHALVFLHQGLPVGVTLFSPDFPGCRTFEVFTDEQGIQELVDFLDPYARPGKRTIRITTRDENAIELFRAVGVVENYSLFDMVKALDKPDRP